MRLTQDNQFLCGPEYHNWDHNEANQSDQIFRSKPRIGPGEHLSEVGWLHPLSEELFMVPKDALSFAVDRRQFTALLAAMGLSSSRNLLSRTSSVGGPEILALSRNMWVPNNDRLPVLIYHRALDLFADDPAAHFERTFLRNGWPPQWRNGIYSFHHYHSTAHEVLGIARQCSCCAGRTGRSRVNTERWRRYGSSGGNWPLLPAGFKGLSCRRGLSAPTVLGYLPQRSIAAGARSNANTPVSRVGPAEWFERAPYALVAIWSRNSLTTRQLSG